MRRSTGRARVLDLVDAVAEAHDAPLGTGEDLLQVGLDVRELPDLLEHAHDLGVRPTVQAAARVATAAVTPP
jgi:aryl carrier-like protein